MCARPTRAGGGLSTVWGGQPGPLCAHESAVFHWNSSVTQELERGWPHKPSFLKLPRPQAAPSARPPAGPCVICRAVRASCSPGAQDAVAHTCVTD